jgi:hypothetical protein
MDYQEGFKKIIEIKDDKIYENNCLDWYLQLQKYKTVNFKSSEYI